MDKFINCEIHTEPQTTLFNEEAGVILSVIDSVLSSFETYPTNGTFILDGQAKDKEAQCIIRFNLFEGSSQKGFCRLCDHKNRDSIAAEAIDRALSWPSKSYYKCPEGREPKHGWLPSGIYEDSFLKVLVLNATHGRFLASFYAEFPEKDADGGTVRVDYSKTKTTAVLVAVATALAKICQEDTVLQQSVEYIQQCAAPTDTEAIQLVNSLFESCSTPQLKAWHDWFEKAHNAGKLTLFFE